VGRGRPTADILQSHEGKHFIEVVGAFARKELILSRGRVEAARVGSQAPFAAAELPIGLRS